MGTRQGSLPGRQSTSNTDRVPSSPFLQAVISGAPWLGTETVNVKNFYIYFVLANHGDIGMALGLYTNFKFKTQLVIIFKPEILFANGMFGW
jgi:hypothetical protein